MKINTIDTEKAKIFVTNYIRPEIVLADVYYGCVMDGEIIGIVGTTVRFSSIAEIKHLYVIEDKRRTGIGKALINRALGGWKGAAISTVRLGNDPAMRLFMKIGFGISCYRPSPYTTHRLYVFIRGSRVSV